MFGFPRAMQRWMALGLAVAVLLAAAAILAVRRERLAVTPAPAPSVLAPATVTPPATLPASPPASASAEATADKSAGPAAYTGLPIQILNADPEVVAKVPAPVFERSQQELTELAATIKARPLDRDAWMRVAYIRQFYNDYAGTRDVYEHVNRIADEFALPFYNLGVLYGYHLGEPEKAGPKFEAALSRDPINPSFYTGFADFSREVLHDPKAAEATLLRGLGRLPGDANLLIALGALFRETGDVGQAIAYYEAALASGALSDAERTAIRAEVERLRSLH